MQTEKSKESQPVPSPVSSRGPEGIWQQAHDGAIKMSEPEDDNEEFCNFEKCQICKHHGNCSISAKDVEGFRRHKNDAKHELCGWSPKPIYRYGSFHEDGHFIFDLRDDFYDDDDEAWYWGDRQGYPFGIGMMASEDGGKTWNPTEGDHDKILDGGIETIDENGKTDWTEEE